jgi:hypothetical protein
MAKFNIEIEVDDELIAEGYEYSPEDIGEIMKELIMMECDRTTTKWFKTRKGNFKSKGQVTRILKKIQNG